MARTTALSKRDSRYAFYSHQDNSCWRYSRFLLKIRFSGGPAGRLYRTAPPSQPRRSTCQLKAGGSLVQEVCVAKPGNWHRPPTEPV